jgi:hypothetical protein
MDVLHRAVAYIQTERLGELQPLLTEPAKSQLAKAGGDGLLKQYRSGRIEFADGAAMNEAHTAVTTRFRLHMPGSQKEDIRVGEVVLRRPATSWQIDSISFPKVQ